MQIKSKIILPGEWYPQSGVMLTWPHRDTDWADILDEVEDTFVEIAFEISKREKLLIITPNPNDTKEKLQNCEQKNIALISIRSNDTWARDHGAISVLIDNHLTIYDFQFNGWGLKFPANYDNLITGEIYRSGYFSRNIRYENKKNFVLEGGSIESDGRGTVITTEKCLLSKNRNQFYSKNQIEKNLKNVFGLERVLWITNGYLEGDDTDSHVDTLVRFCNENTIAYVQCNDISDPHFMELRKMERQLLSFRKVDGKPYNFIPLPMTDPIYTTDGDRLPSTYANFLIINGAVLFPTYNSDKDSEVRKKLQISFPNHDIIGINCLPLVKQYGSLHCVTMQFPEGVLNF